MSDLPYVYRNSKYECRECSIYGEPNNDKDFCEGFEACIEWKCSRCSLFVENIKNEKNE